MKYENIFNEMTGTVLENNRKLKIKLAILMYGNLNLDKLDRIRNWDKKELKDSSDIFKYFKSQ